MSERWARVRVWLIGTALVCLAGVTGSGLSARTAINVLPTTLVLSPGARSTTLTLRNESPGPASFRVTAARWRNTSRGEIVLDPTDDIVFYPPLLRVDPGTSRRIRLGSKIRDAEKELAFRLLVEELPSHAHGESGVQVLTRFSIPVFVQPARRFAAAVLEPPALADGRLNIKIRNTGNVHLTPERLELKAVDATGWHVWSRRLQAWYLLPGDERSHALTLTADECRQVAAIAVDIGFRELSNLNESLIVSARACGSHAP